jgi:hypothetical protein
VDKGGPNILVYDIMDHVREVYHLRIVIQCFLKDIIAKFYFDDQPLKKRSKIRITTILLTTSSKRYTPKGFDSNIMSNLFLL